MGFSIEILNNIRLNASEEYQARIPEATKENLSTVGSALQTYTVHANEFYSLLIEKIGRTIVEQKMFKNKLAKFKSGGIVSSHDVEEIFVEMAKAEGNYDKNGKNPLGRRSGPDVKVIYHRQNRQYYFAISIGDLDFVRVFRSESTLDAFIKGQINSIYSGDEYDEWLTMKELLATYKNKDKTASGYFDYEVPDFASATQGDPVTIKNWCAYFVKTLRKAVTDLSFASTDYNVSGVKTWSNPSDLVLLVHKDIVAEVDVELLANAFHQSNTDMKVVPEIIVMDDFGSLTDTYGLLVDKDFFRVWDTLVHMEGQRNAQGLFTNYFYHHHQILSLSSFKNAVRFKRVDIGE